MADSYEVEISGFGDPHTHWRNQDSELFKLSADLYNETGYQWAFLMPNTSPPLERPYRMTDYLKVARERARDVALYGYIYLAQRLTAKDIVTVSETEEIVGVKWYPAGKGGTTGSEHGVTIEEVFNNKHLDQILKTMEDLGVVLSIHGEDPDYDNPHRRERVFMLEVFPKLRLKYPKLKISLEHISTEEGAGILLLGGEHTFATITAHHLFSTYEYGEDPNKHCFPPLSSPKDQLALHKLIMLGLENVALCTDHAPHLFEHKQGKSPKGGCFTGPHAPLLFATVLDRLFNGDSEKVRAAMQAMCCDNVMRFFGLKKPEGGKSLRLAKIRPYEYNGFYTNEFGVVALFPAEDITFEFAT